MNKISKPLSNSPLSLALVSFHTLSADQIVSVESSAEARVTDILAPPPLLAGTLLRVYPGATLHDDMDSLLNHSRATAVVFSSHNSHDYSDIQSAICSGKHALFCSKNFGNRAQLIELDYSARERGVVCMPAGYFRCDGRFRQIAQWLSEGVAGALRIIRCDWQYGGNTANNLHATGDARALTCDMAHVADLCSWWLGDAETVSAEINLESRTRNSACQTVIVGHVFGTSIQRVVESSSPSRIFHIVFEGSKGTLDCRLNLQNVLVFKALLQIPGQPGRDIAKLAECNDAAVKLGNVADFKHFINCVQGLEIPCITCGDAAHAAEVTEAACLSSVEKVKVSLPLGQPLERERLLSGEEHLGRLK